MSNLEVKLNITNYNPHPENVNYTVFHFYRDEMAEYFESLLKKKNIPYERAEEKFPKRIILFGIKNSYQKEAVRLNYLAIGKFRERFISNPVFAIGLILIVVLLIVFALIGTMYS